MIEFRKGDKWCRWNGFLMSPKNTKKLFGVDFEVYFEDGVIDTGDVIYTDKPIGELLLMYGESYEKPEPYDMCIDQGYGWKDHCWEEKLAGKIVFDIDFIKNLNIKPFSQFKKDYPNFNKKEHDKFYNELDAYYEDMRNPKPIFKIGDTIQAKDKRTEPLTIENIDTEYRKYIGSEGRGVYISAQENYEIVK